MPPETTGYVICDEKLGECICTEERGHELPHKCHSRSAFPGGHCKGEWNGDGSDTPGNEIVTYPDGSKTEAEALAHLARLRVRGDNFLLDLMPRTVKRGGIRFGAGLNDER